MNGPRETRPRENALSAAIFFFVLAVGAFITVTMKTESIQTGIGRLALRHRHSGSMLVAILMSRETGVPIKQLIVMNKAELIGAIEQSERAHAGGPGSA